MARTYRTFVCLLVLASCEIAWGLWSYNLARKVFSLPEPCA